MVAQASPDGSSTPAGRGVFRSPAALFVLLSASLGVFEGMHRGLGVHPVLSSIVLMLVYVPLLIWAILVAVSAILADPDDLAHTVLWVFGFAFLTMAFFAVLFTELGIVASGGDGRVIHAFTTALYFSAATFTTLGYGDFAPAPGSRLIAAVEAFTGYVVLGMITAVVFYLLSRWAGRIARPRS